LVAGLIQNVIQTISSNPHFHKDHALRDDSIVRRRECCEVAVQQICWRTIHGRVSVQSATRKNESAASEPAERKASPPPAKKSKLSVLLITRDDLLWPQVGTHLGNDLVLKQVDSIDELVTATPQGQPAIVLWDARNQTDASAVFSRLQLHSPRFAVVVLDDAGNSPAWTNPIALRQVVAQVVTPIAADKLTAAVESAQEEVNARVALLGEAGATAVGTPPPPRKIPWIPASITLVVLAAGAAAYVFLGHGAAPVKAVPAASPQHATQTAAKPAPASDEKVDLLIEKAQQAMLDRHFIDPADGSALTLYRNALLLDPDNGEARQGLQRLAEILFSRVQSALDDRKFDVALQSLESARSINPGDGRLTALDERIASLRAEFGPAQILAAISAQNFDRAAQLIDEAARTKSLSAAKLAQLREELRRRHQESDVGNFVKLIDTRLQQDKLIEPHNDSAVYYLSQARAAGAGAAALQSQSQEIDKRLAQMVRADIDQKRLLDADRLLADLHSYGVPASTIAGLQHELTAARSPQVVAAPEQPQYLELAQSRLAQGKVTEPDTDSALFYVNQLRVADPKNAALAQISNAVQAKILEQARAALDTAQLAKAESLLQSAGGLGASADLNSLNDRLLQMKLAAAGTPEVVEATMSRVKAIQLDYPEEALRRNIEGWVDLSYGISADGKVANVKVFNSSPAGVFDSAATRAIYHVRYKPMMQNGRPIAVTTKLRIAFRMTK
jgi:TonB family protein